MREIYHLNCVKTMLPINGNVCGHCLLVKENDRLILIDTGLGPSDTQNPMERVGQQAIDIGSRFNEHQTALRQIELLGFAPENVTDCIISHLDNDHIGGLADFPKATVHVALEELESFWAGNARYLQTPLAHRPVIKTYENSILDWFGFEARKLDLDLETDILLIPLFGHTLGHCGVALQLNGKWFFYIADAYYMRLELYDRNHPVNELARRRADDNALRVATLDNIRKLVEKYPEVDVFGYHDISEFNCHASGSK